MRRTSLTTLLLAGALTGLSAESFAAARAMQGAPIRHGRTKRHAQKPSAFEKNILRPATYKGLLLRGKISREDYAAATRGAK